MKIQFILNEKPCVVDCPGERRLLDVLREDLHLTGTKESCGEGECGACTVIINGKACHSCLTMIAQVDGAEVLTIEGLEKNGELVGIQQSFIDNFAIQCGACTPGMIMSAKALLLSNPNPTEREVRIAISGNICRCSDYNNIVKAVLAVAEKGQGAAAE